MTNLFVVYLAAIAVPVWFPSWRVAVLGLGLQGLMLSFVPLAAHDIDSPAVVLEFACLLLIRAVFVPWYLFRKADPRFTPRPFVLVGTTLWERSLVLLLIGVGFAMGLTMGQGDARETVQIGTASSGLLVGMLLVANQRQRVAQLVGLFTFEGGVTLVQLLSPHAVPFPVQLGVTVIDVLFVLTLGQYLARFPEIVPPDEPADSPAEREGV